MKKLLFILLTIPLLFSSCQTCKECKPDEAQQVVIGYDQVQTGNMPGGFYTDANGQIQQSPSTPIYEQVPIYGDGIKVSLEICRDNFDSKSDYNTYIGDLENEGYSCVSDFWN